MPCRHAMPAARSMMADGAEKTAREGMSKDSKQMDAECRKEAESADFVKRSAWDVCKNAGTRKYSEKHKIIVEDTFC
jgi:hypothetical protein